MYTYREVPGLSLIMEDTLPVKGSPGTPRRNGARSPSGVVSPARCQSPSRGSSSDLLDSDSDRSSRDSREGMMTPAQRYKYLQNIPWRRLRRTFFIIIGVTMFVYTSIAYLQTAQLEAFEKSEGVVCEQAHAQFKKPIPKIIHQMWKNSEVPERWKSSQRNCQMLNPDYEYKLWTDGEIEAFLKKEYPWFMETYNSYPYPIQRVDSSRYFILHHHGGFYLDLDIDCVVPLDRILENVTSSSDVIMAATDPVGITNNFLAGKPNHPYFKLLTQSLLTANVQRWSPHLTIMLSSGPLFVYQTYLHYGCKEQFHILSVAEHKSCFHHEQAATWHGWDGPLVTFLDRHQKALLPLAFVVIAITAFLLIYCVFRYYILKSNNRKTGENKEKINKFLL